MRAHRIEDGFGIDSLREVELPTPEPGPHQVLIDVRAISLNFRDLMVVRGEYGKQMTLPHVPCSDAAGVVRAVGPGVSRVKIGDRVATVFAPRWQGGRATHPRVRNALGGAMQGVLATHFLASEEGVLVTPPELTDEEACTLVCAGTTAWHALVDHGHLMAGETVLVQGTGAVSIFALQIARLMGARVIATSSKADKRARLAQMGAFATLDYGADPQWGKAARLATGGVGVDHVVEVGGAGTMGESLRAVAVGGSIYVIGVLAGNAPPVDVRLVLMNEVRMQGVMVGPRDSHEALARAFATSGTHPVIDRVFSFGEAREALRYLESGAHFGKVLIRVEP